MEGPSSYRVGRSTFLSTVEIICSARALGRRGCHMFALETGMFCVGEGCVWRERSVCLRQISA